MRTGVWGREVPCPRCGASTGEPCRGRRGPRKALHRERLEIAARVSQAGPVPEPVEGGSRRFHAYRALNPRFRMALADKVAGRRCPAVRTGGLFDE
jgi:hypothetical protein